MSRWSAPSDYDYYDEVEARSTWDRATTLHCIRCERPVIVDADEPGPVWCASCRDRADAIRSQTEGDSGEAA